MKRVFISLPMKDKTDQEILEARKAAQEEIQKILYNESLQFIDTWVGEEPPVALEGDMKSLWCLGKSLEKLAEADVLYCSDKWHEYRGCVLEREAAKKYGIKVYDYANYLMTCIGSR